MSWYASFILVNLQAEAVNENVERLTWQRNSLGQGILQEIPIQANTIHELVEKRGQLARLAPEGLRETRREQGDWSVDQPNPRNCS